MADNNTLVAPVFEYLIKYLNQEIPKYKDSDEEYKQIIYEDLIRTKKLLENIKVYGVQILNTSYEQYCENLEEKHNIVFLTDEEMQEIRKVLKIYAAIKEME